MKKHIVGIAMVALQYAAMGQASTLLDSPCGEVKVEQLSVMIMPFIKEGETPRKVWESSDEKRIAVAKVNEFFQGRGFQTVDFLDKLKSAEENKILTLENVTDHKQELLRYSGAEIGVEVDMTFSKQGDLTTPSIVLRASEGATATNMGSVADVGNPNRSTDLNAHAVGVVSLYADKFLDQLRANFSRMLTDGRPMTLTFSFSQASGHDINERIDSKDGKPLWYVLKKWVQENAFKNLMGEIIKPSPTYLEMPMVRIPVRDPKTCMKFSTDDFAIELQMFLESLGIQNDQVIKSGKILTTIK